MAPHAHADTHAHKQHTYTSPTAHCPAPPLAGTCSMDLGHAATRHTEAHAWPESQHRSLPAYRRHLHQLPAHLCLACSEGHLQISVRNRFCFLRVQLSFLCPRAFPGSLPPMSLSPSKSSFSVDSEGSPTWATVPRAIPAYSSSFCLLSAPASGSPSCLPRRTSPTLPLPTPVPCSASPPEPHLSRHPASLKSSCPPPALFPKAGP